jgi:hypothetical protein
MIYTDSVFNEFIYFTVYTIREMFRELHIMLWRNSTEEADLLRRNAIIQCTDSSCKKKVCHTLIVKSCRVLMCENMRTDS